MKEFKKIAILQPYFFPYIGYFQIIDACDIFIVFDDVNYINKGWINRNRILLNGLEHFVNLPLSKASQNKLINEINVSEEYCIHQKKLLDQIKHGYKKAPFFKEIYPIIEQIILNQEKDLVKYLVYSLLQLCNYLGISFNYQLSSSIAKDNSKKGQFKIIEICNILNANCYINPIGGTDLYDKNIFLSNDIDLKFISTQPIAYKQFDNKFIPHLSIIDLLMFNSKNEAKILIKNYNLI